MSNFLSNIFGGFFKKSDDSAIGIDIGSSAIKVVQLKNENGEIKLETYGALAMGPYADKTVGQAVKLPINTVSEVLLDLLKETETTTTNGGVAIPFSSTLMQIIELPKVEEEELQKIVPIEARKYIPASIEEVSLDWVVVPEDGKDKTETDDKKDDSEEKEVKEKRRGSIHVLMVAIHNDVVERHKRIMDKSGLGDMFFEVEIFSTIRSVMQKEDEPVLVFDMGAASVKLYIIEREVVRKTHIINRGSQDITEAISNSLGVDTETAEILKRGLTPEGKTDNRSMEVREAASGVLESMIQETGKVRQSYEERSGKEISRCILVGGGVRFQGIAEAIERDLNLPAELANPFKRFEYPSFLENVLTDTGPEFAVAAGVALRKLQE